MRPQKRKFRHLKAQKRKKAKGDNKKKGWNDRKNDFLEISKRNMGTSSPDSFETMPEYWYKK